MGDMANDSLPPTTSFPASENVVGRTYGRYRVVGFLGRGGMGTVYQVHDPDLGRDVALKLLPSDVVGDAERLKRFEREMRALGRLDHPHVIRVLDVGREGEQPFLITELASGSVQDQRRAEPVGWVQVTQWMAQACRGLVAVHAAGLIHRDIKPSNILVGNDGMVKLADFGLVRFADPTTELASSTAPKVLGTPHFMSPEQCRCESIDERSDLYSLGATYYALLTGQPPFTADDPLKILFAHCSTPAPDARAIIRDLPDACAAIIAKAMQKSPTQRYQQASAMLADMEAVLAMERDRSTLALPMPQPPRPRRWPWGIAVALPIAALAVALVAWPPRDSPPDSAPPNDSQPIQEANWSTAWEAGGPVTALAVHPTEPNRVAWGTATGLVVDALDGKELYRHQGHGAVRSIAYFLAGRQGQASLAQHGIVVWDARKNVELYTKDPAACEGEISVLGSWGPFSTIAALSQGLDRRGGFKVWNNSERLPAAFGDWREPVWSLATSGEYLFAGGDAGKVQRWQPDKAIPPEHIATGLGRVTMLAAWNQGERFAAADESQLQFWVYGETKPKAFALTQVPRRALAISPDGNLLVESFGATIRAWNANTAQELGIRAEHQQPIFALQFAADGKTLYSGGADGTIRVWPRSSWERK